MKIMVPSSHCFSSTSILYWSRLNSKGGSVPLWVLRRSHTGRNNFEPTSYVFPSSPVAGGCRQFAISFVSRDQCSLWGLLFLVRSGFVKSTTKWTTDSENPSLIVPKVTKGHLVNNFFSIYFYAFGVELTAWCAGGVLGAGLAILMRADSESPHQIERVNI